MPDLNFQVVMAEPEPFSAGPLLRFKLRVSQSAAAGAEIVPIHAVMLQCQVRIEPAQRRYETAEQEKLLDLFDAPPRWGQTLRSMLWANTSVAIGPFMDAVSVDLPVPCTYDFNVAVTKYFYALAWIPTCPLLLTFFTLFSRAAAELACRSCKGTLQFK